MKLITFFFPFFALVLLLACKQSDLPLPLSDAAEILRISDTLGGITLSPDAEVSDAYKLTLPDFRNLTSLDLNFVLSDGATYEPLGAQDFSKNNPITFTVTAEDGTTTKIYTITVELAPSTDTGITSIGEELGSKPLEPVDLKANAYKVILPHGTDLSALNLDLQLASTEATYEPLGAQDFSKNNPITFTVTAEDGTTTKIYIVTVDVGSPPLSDAAEMISVSRIVEVDDFLAIKDSESDSFMLYIEAGKFPANGKLTIIPVLSPGANMPEEPQFFSLGVAVDFIVSAEDEETERTYSITLDTTTSFLSPRVRLGENGWIKASPQSEGSHTGIWKIEDLLRLGSGKTDALLGGDVWKLKDNYVLMANLNFTDAGDYRNPNDSTLDADGDVSTTEGIQAELSQDSSRPLSKGFQPIGKGNNRFIGSFEGNRKTISNLYINRPKTDYVGLFKSLDDQAKVSQLGIIKAHVTGSVYVGGLAGMNRGEIITSYITGEVTGTGADVGGLVGYNQHIIEQAYSIAVVTGGSSVGGLVGNDYYGSISDSIAFSKELKSDSKQEIGRVIGDWQNEGTLNNNYGRTNMGFNGVGMGVQPDGDLRDGENLSPADFGNQVFFEDSQNFNKVWDFAAVWEIKAGQNRPTFKNNTTDRGLIFISDEKEMYGVDNIKEVKLLEYGKNNDVDEFIFYITTTHDPASKITIIPNIAPGASYEPQGAQNFSDPVRFTITAEDKKTSKDYILRREMMGSPQPRVQPREDGLGWEVADPQREGTHTGIWKIEDLIHLGSGESDEFYGGDVWKLEDNYVMMANLDFMRAEDYRNPKNKKFDADGDDKEKALMKELTPTHPNTEGFKPIGNEAERFTGEFRGNGKTISNLYINRIQDNEDFGVGLFSYTSDTAKIDKIGIISARVTGKEDGVVGALVGGNSGEIVQSYAKNIEVVGKAMIGGLVGGNSGSIKEAYVTGTVRGDEMMGGIAGYNGNIIEASIAFVDKIMKSQSQEARDVSRVAGRNEGNIRNNYANEDMLLGDSKIPIGDRNNKEGFNINKDDFTDRSFYENPDNFPFTTDGISFLVWNFSTTWEMSSEGPIHRQF